MPVTHLCRRTPQPAPAVRRLGRLVRGRGGGAAADPEAVVVVEGGGVREEVAGGGGRGGRGARPGGPTGRRGRVDVEGREAVLRVGRPEAGEGAAEDGGRDDGGHLLRVGGRVDQPRLAAAPGLQNGRFDQSRSTLLLCWDRIRECVDNPFRTWAEFQLLGWEEATAILKRQEEESH